MWVPFSPAWHQARCSGFSLIELLVVLALVGVTAGLVGPRLWTPYERANERLVVIDYNRELMALRKDLMVSGRALVIKEGELFSHVEGGSTPSLRTGWSITENSRLVFLSTGVTSGGQIVFSSPTGRMWRLELTPLDGKSKVQAL